ncbi:MAG: hypothetical protein GY856_09190 [bacterium]|nr:hypothetical protein [bacterium]
MGRILERLIVAVLIAAVGLPALELVDVGTRLVVGTLHVQGRSPWIFTGLVAGAVTFLQLRQNPRIRFLDTLQHELTHVAAALVLGASPQSVSAMRGSGLTHFELGGPARWARQFLISIAPYCVSPVLLLPVTLAWALPGYERIVLLLVAGLFGFALVLPVAQLNLRQTDLRRYGLVPPLVAGLWVWAATFVCTIELLAAESIRAVPRAYETAWYHLVGMFG